jgi:DNA-binding MarR family transcriptional regulator
MLVLWEEPGRPRSVGELGERLHLDSGTLTPLLKRLAAMGYVTRSRDAEDERRVLVSVTAEGLALRDRLAAIPESLLACLGMDAARQARSARNWRRSPLLSKRAPAEIVRWIAETYGHGSARDSNPEPAD